ncbi:TetR family transcriptional regulator [Aliidiomarina iranensis]|uniref:TetR family transcriptional regulator n=1 Tax=Aliidiomarina iranensis TaxID=1434071 RepID=A0A432VZV2_9GAMM|nr:TetR/AcrR family transcriptional regulator [Aliidiomarina iranensis]RUO22276.1 TetR family transcriptional regulator [Aliidiomarina iranensis]
MSEEMKKKRIHKPAEERQAEILDAAVKIFAHKGYQVADVQTIAEHAGVGKGTVYRYFPTKEDLFKQALIRQLDILRCKMWQAHDSTNNPLRRLKVVMATYFTFFDEHPETIELFVHERAEFGHEQTPLYFVRMHEHTEDWIPMFKALKAELPNCENDIEEMMCLCGEIMHGTVYLSKAIVPNRPALERLEQTYRFYLQGLVKHADIDQLYYLHNL